MTNSKKLLLSIPSIIGLLFMIVLFFPKETLWLVPNIRVYNTFVISILILSIIQLIYLIRKLWSKNLKKSIKTNWTWLLIIYTSITSLVFIWKKIDEFENSNNQT